jgi:Tat protein translocase TatB subunit
MNIFSNIGITELIVILLLALLVVGPERLPELGRKLGKTLRDLRRAYDNLTSDLGPELRSLQRTTQELRESVESVTSIPQDMVQSMVKAAELDDTIEELKGVTDSVGEMRTTLSSAGQVIRDPVKAAVGAAQGALLPEMSHGKEAGKEEAKDGVSADPEQQDTVDDVVASQEEQETIDEALAIAKEAEPKATVMAAEVLQEQSVKDEVPAEQAEKTADATPAMPEAPEATDDAPAEQADE